MSEQTIFAQASGAGRAGVAVIRISGAGAGAGLKGLIAAGASGQAVAADGIATLLPRPREACLRRLGDPASGDFLDEALVIWFPGPASFTGEDVVELHVHGGVAVISAVLLALGGIAGFRPATPGEFTRRAFHHGRMDLTQAEAIADLVAAETAEQRRQAQRQAAGELGSLYEAWRQALLEAMAHFEATIDFADEDLPPHVAARARDRVTMLRDDLVRHLADGRRGERLRHGVHVALLGPPNAGKSTVLNMIAGREAAIVSATEGTTRDIVEVHLDLGGVPVILADTAGLRDADDEVEVKGVARARSRAAEVDLKVVILDRLSWPSVPAAVRTVMDGNCLLVVNKIDLAPFDAATVGPDGVAVLPLSAKTGEGMETLLDHLAAAARSLADTSAGPLLTRSRHRSALEEAKAALDRALIHWDLEGPEVTAEDLRLAITTIGRITGRVDVEDLLDVIFADFCIGK